MTGSLGAQAPAAATAPVGRPTSLRFTEAGRAALTAQMHEAVKKGVLYQGSSGLPMDTIFNIASMTRPVHMMQLLPFYDDGAIRALRGFEQTMCRELK